MSSDRAVMEHLVRNLECIADHCMTRFRIPNNRSLVKALRQPDQISNRSAVLCWIGEQVLDPKISNEDNLCQVMCERLALVLVELHPYRWSQILSDVMRKDPLPSFAFLDAMRRLVAESQA